MTTYTNLNTYPFHIYNEIRSNVVLYYKIYIDFKGFQFSTKNILIHINPYFLYYCNSRMTNVIQNKLKGKSEKKILN